MTQGTPPPTKSLELLLRLIQEAYKESGKQLETAVLITADQQSLEEGTMVIDNREKEDIQ